jgi:ABC-type cobalamin/Fe3+-siderophores transport system ATPase subunit
VVVVGPCAAGKTTLVDGLRGLGYDAAVVGQEHSDIGSLWQRTRPDALIALEVDLATIRRRRGTDWSEAMYAAQRRRLTGAVAAATVVLDANRLSPMALLGAAAGALREAGIRPRGPAGPG